MKLVRILDTCALALCIAVLVAIILYDTQSMEDGSLSVNIAILASIMWTANILWYWFLNGVTSLTPSKVMFSLSCIGVLVWGIFFVGLILLKQYDIPTVMALLMSVRILYQAVLHCNVDWQKIRQQASHIDM